jgi:hypothetical protein
MFDQWEYKIKALPNRILDAQIFITEMGEQGCELLTILRHPASEDFMPTAESKLFTFFKRPKSTS